MEKYKLTHQQWKLFVEVIDAVSSNEDNYYEPVVREIKNFLPELFEKKYYDDPRMKDVLEELFGGDWELKKPEWSVEFIWRKNDRSIFREGGGLINESFHSFDDENSNWHAQLAAKGYYPVTMKPKKEKERKPRIKRLRKLANHLLNGEFGHSFYLFLPEDEKSSGSFKNISSQFPDLWPKVWTFSGQSIHFKKGREVHCTNPVFLDFECTSKFFNISDTELSHLFIPLSQRCERYGGDILDQDSTKEEVANNILEFCKRYEKTTENYD